MSILLPKLTTRDLPGVIDWIERFVAAGERGELADLVADTEEVADDAVDPNFASVVVLLHGDGADGSTAFVDSSSHGWSFVASGNAQIDTAQSVFGGASMAFDGTGDYVTQATAPAELLFGTGAFTIEGWFYSSNLGVFRWMLSTMASGASVDTADTSWGLHVGTDGKLRFDTWNGAVMTATTAVGTGSWHHFAVSFDGATYRLFLDGALEATYAPMSAIDFSVNYPLTVGHSGYSGATGNMWNGWLDDIRITKGICRYVDPFDPPTAAYPNSA